VQDTYVTALEKTDAFLGLSSQKTYLYRIVINKSLDARRRRVRFRDILDAMSRELPWVRQSATEDPDAKELVQTLLNKIPDKFRIPLVLSEIDGMSYEEIADTLQVSQNTVRTRIFRCREKLRKEFIKTGHMP
jgi:RNA polymerase sigma-70 factor (ECF subfamily)